jgi:hypothetical protein
VLLRLAYYLLACLLTMVFTGLLFLLRGAIGPELVAAGDYDHALHVDHPDAPSILEQYIERPAHPQPPASN